MDFNGNTLEPVSPQGDVDHFDHCATPKRKTKAKPQKMTGISLFSGGGGLDIGVHEADFRTLACIELDSRSEEHTSALQSLMRISYAVFCLKKKPTTSTVNSNISMPSPTLPIL